ncbi:hypothetical protein K466DRAFT_605537 [Polyporus arcularius HHB13444]|uniref:Uncharacterized protein n=1 Tax=Polyporus arcularius HHB13444 TaxID=1314778 RepID=A0A5C3NTU2_9APHY|nr:hypothetical protein K466DRAFT_605537 [Polyporus arcularius HHB13444]
MLIDVAVSLDVASLPPPPAGDYSVVVDITEDCWCGPDGTRLRTFLGRVIPGSEDEADRTNVSGSTPANTLRIRAPSLSALMAWIHSLNEDNLETMADISVWQREVLLTFGIIGVRIGRQYSISPSGSYFHASSSSCETATRTVSPGVATAEEIMGLAGWAQQYYPGCLTLGQEELPPRCAILADSIAPAHPLDAAASWPSVYRQPEARLEGVHSAISMLEPAYRSFESSDDESELPELIPLEDMDNENAVFM